MRAILEEKAMANDELFEMRRNEMRPVERSLPYIETVAS